MLSFVCLVTFSMIGGELFSRIQERADVAFTERGQSAHSFPACLVIADSIMCNAPCGQNVKTYK